MRTLLVLAVFGSAIIPSAFGQQLDEKILAAQAELTARLAKVVQNEPRIASQGFGVAGVLIVVTRTL